MPGSKPGERRGGRQKGTPNKVTPEVRLLARAYGPAAVERLAQLAGLQSDKQGNPIPGAPESGAQIAAIKELLDRGYGKSVQMVAGDPDGAPVSLVLRRVIVHGADDRPSDA